MARLATVVSIGEFPGTMRNNEASQCVRIRASERRLTYHGDDLLLDESGERDQLEEENEVELPTIVSYAVPVRSWAFGWVRGIQRRQEVPGRLSVVRASSWLDCEADSKDRQRNWWLLGIEARTVLDVSGVSRDARVQMSR
jgi:hypothetical protein